MTIKEAVILVLESALLKSKSNLFVLDMGQPIKILDLAKKIINFMKICDYYVVMKIF